MIEKYARYLYNEYSIEAGLEVPFEELSNTSQGAWIREAYMSKHISEKFIDFLIENNLLEKYQDTYMDDMRKLLNKRHIFLPKTFVKAMEGDIFDSYIAVDSERAEKMLTDLMERNGMS